MKERIERHEAGTGLSSANTSPAIHSFTALAVLALTLLALWLSRPPIADTPQTWPQVQLPDPLVIHPAAQPEQQEIDWEQLVQNVRGVGVGVSESTLATLFVLLSHPVGWALVLGLTRALGRIGKRGHRRRRRHDEVCVWWGMRW